MTDRELLDRAHNGDRQAANVLAGEYMGMAKRLASRYFFAGADHDDVVQEAMVGLVGAIRSWDPGRSDDAKPFLILCMERAIITGVKTSQRQKHLSLTRADSLDQVVGLEDGEGMSRVELVDSGQPDPSQQLERQERLRNLVHTVNHGLSGLERRTLIGYVNGETYAEMEGLPAGTKVKKVDNALQRARRKLAAAA